MTETDSLNNLGVDTFVINTYSKHKRLLGRWHSKLRQQLNLDMLFCFYSQLDEIQLMLFWTHGNILPCRFIYYPLSINCVENVTLNYVTKGNESTI